MKNGWNTRNGKKKKNYNRLTYDFKGQTTPISFLKFRGPMNTYDQLKNDKKHYSK